MTLNGPFYAQPSSEIKTHAMYPNTNNIPPNAVIEGMNNIVGSCQNLSLSYTSSKSNGVALNTFTYLWWTDIPSGFASIVDPTLSTLYITDFMFAANFNVFLQVSNIFGKSSIAQYPVTINPAPKEITVALDIGDNVKVIYTNSLVVQARIVDFCGVIGTATYSWSISNSSVLFKCYLRRCYFFQNQFKPGVIYSLQVLAQVSNSLGVYQSTATTVITSEYAAPIARIHEPSGNLKLGTFSNDEVVQYTSLAFDPNSVSFTISWSSTIPGFENLGNASVLALKKLDIFSSQVTEFNLTLTVDNGYKVSAETIHITVIIKDVSPFIYAYFDKFQYFQATKIPKNSYVILSTRYIYNYYNYRWDGPVDYDWNVNPPIQANIPHTEGLMLLASNFNSGTYIFTVVVTIQGVSDSAYISRTFNAGAACPIDAVKFSPGSGIKTSTLLAFTISNCIDSDAEDLPLKYTFGYSTAKNKRVNYITTASYNTQYAFKFPSGTIFGNFTICDSLNDCTFAVSSPATVVKGRLRNLKDSAWIYDEYKQESQMYELPAVITYFLESYEIPDDLIDIMWTNFTVYINNQILDIDLFMIVESIAFQFINYQTTTLAFERLEAYVNYVKVCLKDLKEIDFEEDFRIIELADLILDVSLEMPYVILANNLLNTLLDLNFLPMSAVFNKSTSHFALLCVEDVVNQLKSAVFTLGSLSLDVINTSIPSTYMLEVKAVAYSLGNYSDIFSVSFKSNKALKNNTITNETCEVNLKEGDVLVDVPVSDNEVRCIMWNNLAWVEEGCIILETADGISKVSITKSGIYTLTTVSSENLRVPLYCITSLIILALILVPLFEYLDKTQTSIELNTKNRKTPEEIIMTEPDLASQETVMPVITLNFISYHLLTSLLKPHEVFSRAKRIILLISNISLMIYFSNLVLFKISISPFISGVIVSAIVFPLSLVVNILLAKAGKMRNITGVSIMFAMCVVAAVGIFLLQAQSDWLISFLVSVAIELFLSQTLIMLVMKAIS